MHRHISRAARRSIAEAKNGTTNRTRVRSNAMESIQVFHTFSSSQDYYFSLWKPQLGTRYTQLQIVNALRLGDRVRASKMLVNISNANGTLSPDDFSFVLDYCAKTPDPLFVMETWRIMVEKAVAIDARCCRSIVQAFSKAGYLEEAFNWLTFVAENDFAHAVLPLYNIFLSGVSSQSFIDVDCGSRQSFIDVDRCVELMEDRFVGKSEITYWQRLKFAVFRRNLSAVHDIWKDCTKYYNPSIITLRKFIWSFTRLNALESAYALLQRMVALLAQESSTVRTSSAGRYQSSRLDIPIPSYSELPHKIIESEGATHTPNIFHDARIKSKGAEGSSMDQFDRKCQSFYNIDKDSILGSFTLGSSLVGNRIRDGLTKEIIDSPPFSSAGPSGVDAKYLEEFAELNLEFIRQPTLGFVALKGRLSPQVKNILRWSFNNVMHACAQAKNCKLAEQLFMQMDELGVEPSRDTYNGFLKAVLHGKGVIYCMDVIESMKNRNMMPCNDTLAAISTGCCKELELDMAEDLLDNISDCLPKYVHPFNAILAACDVTIRALGAEGMIHEMLRYLNRAESMLNIDTFEKLDLYNTVLHALVKAKESSTAIELFKNMRFCCFPANAATYNMMIECCSISGCFKSASSLLSLMLRDGFVPQTLTYNALIKVLLANDDFGGAVSLLDQAIYEGIQLDIQLFNTVLKQAYLEGRINIVELIIELIHRKKIQPDPSTCWYTFSAYVELGFNSTALEALQVLSLRMISEDASILQSHKAEYEDLIYSEEPDIESKIVDMFKETREFIATSLLSLRWCAINGMHILWSPQESLWAKRLSSSFDTRREAD